MHSIFRDMVNRFVVIYIDDTLIYHPCLSQHINHVRQVLQRLQEYHIFVKGEKCEFHQARVQFLGYVIKPGVVTMDERKVVTIQEWLRPCTIKEL